LHAGNGAVEFEPKQEHAVNAFGVGFHSSGVGTFNIQRAL
jgi:hypothetical protein